MLTLNSNILKIGNKWILPVNSGGVVPPVPTVYQVTTSATHGTVTASPTEGISGTEVTLSNTPDTHYHFGSYSLTGATLKNANQFDIADSDVSVVGNFIEDTKYSVTVNQSTGGTISASPVQGYTGTEVTLSNTPATHYSFGSYNLTGATLKSANKFDIGTSNVTVGATWIEDTKYSVTCTNDGHGTIAASPTSNYSGSTVTLSNTPNSGYTFDKYTLVSGTGASISGNTLTIGTSNVTVRGDFVAQAPVSYNYFLLELTGYSNSSYWRGGWEGGYYGVKSFKYNGSSVTTSNCKAGYVDSNNINRAVVNTEYINALAYTGDYNSSPYYWGDQYNSSYASLLANTYILVGTGTAISSGTVSFEDLLQNSNVPSDGDNITITSKLYGVPSSAVSSSSGQTYVTLSACTLLNTGTHTAKCVPWYSSIMLNTTTISYGV